jgi:predicted phosphodiesterase
MSRILAIGDVHEPVSHPAYLQFCLDLYDQWECDSVVFIGDLADHNAISFHASNPMCPGPDDEYLLTFKAIQKWYAAFPDAKVCIGNHDARVLRLAESVSMPSRYLRDFNETWQTHGWEWDYDFMIDGVLYMHGTGVGGVHPAWNSITKRMSSVVLGHCHSRAGVKFLTNGKERFFGLDTGCGIDVKAWQFAYGKNFAVRPCLAAGIVLDGKLPYSEVMLCSPGERYHRSLY